MMRTVMKSKRDLVSAVCRRSRDAIVLLRMELVGMCLGSASAGDGGAVVCISGLQDFLREV